MILQAWQRRGCLRRGELFDVYFILKMDEAPERMLGRFQFYASGSE